MDRSVHQSFDTLSKLLLTRIGKNETTSFRLVRLVGQTFFLSLFLAMVSGKTKSGLA
jgi:hypothetical protein